MSTRHRQLTFDVAPRKVRRAGEDVPAEVLGGELKIKGGLRCDTNLEHGDELVIIVQGAGGEVLARCYAEVAAPPSFAPIEERDVGLIGYSRVHTAKVGDPLE